MLLDANILLSALDSSSAQHERAVAWVEETFNGDRRIALPWQTIGAVARIATHPRVMRRPLTAGEVWQAIDAWLSMSVCWIPPTTERTVRLLGDLLHRTGVTGNRILDAQLAAIALEHGLAVVSTDSDFARFPDVRWWNPLT